MHVLVPFGETGSAAAGLTKIFVREAACDADKYGERLAT
jgi:hypothetical protein